MFGAQASVLMLVPYGRMGTDVDATLFGALGPFGFARGVSASEAISGFGDPVPQINLRWNMGVHNVMSYVTGNIPVGRYDPNRLANLGIGHQALDAGAGYTYFNPHTGWEFSSVLGFTYNFENKDTLYKNGVDAHLDWGGSRFINKQPRSDWSATSTSSSVATAALATGLDASNRGSSASGRRSASFSRWGRFRVISTSRATRNSPPKTVRRDGTRG